MGKPRLSTEVQGLTLDAGALLALERGDRRFLALLRLSDETGGVFHVPAGVLGQVWRRGARQARVAALLGKSRVQVVPLDARMARACGELCGAAGTADVIHASVVIVARTFGDMVVTSDPGDIRALDARLELLAI